MVGFMAKTKTEKAKSNLKFRFPLMISFKIIKDSTIAGKSGLGDCKNNKKTGEIKSKIHVFFSNI